MREISVEVMDIEVFPNFFSYTGYDIKTEKIVQYYIFEEVNDLVSLIDHLKILIATVGFNNLNYDYPILHYMWVNLDKLMNMDSRELTYHLYEKSQQVIGEAYSDVPFREVKLLQIDLYRIWHLDNKARRASLKDIEIWMNFPRVEDLPFKFNHYVQCNEVEKILEYNLNDVMATYEFYKHTLDALALRKKIQKKYGIPCISYNNGKIGSELLLKLYCSKTGKNPFEVKKLRTYRNNIPIKDIIFDYISFKSKEFNSLLDHFKSINISKTKKEGDIGKDIIYKGFKYVYGLGGIHGSIAAGVYESDEEYILQDCDVSSLYPSIPIANKLYPEHLGEEFYEIYKDDIVAVRLAEKAKKADGDKAIVDGFKEAANVVYGKSNEEYSWLYDPKYTMQTTINGQLMLTMLAEEIVDSIKDITMIQINTDGLTIKIKRKDLDKYYEICNRWQTLTKLELEYASYDKMVIRDVNNYLAVYDNGKIKYKGAFEFDKLPFKDPSNRIVPLTLSNYFVKGIPIEETIRNHDNIFDFCKRFKATHGWRSELVELDVDSGTAIRTKCQKTNRYYISKKGGTYIKVHDDDRVSQIEAGWNSIIYNTHDKTKKIEDYDIDYSYYIKECYKIIDVIENKQLMLF